MKTFYGSLLAFTMNVQGLLLSSTLHANSPVIPSSHSNQTKDEPDIFTDAFLFCKKQIPNSDESTLDTAFTVVAMMAFDELIHHLDGGDGKKSSFGSPTSKSFVRDFAKLPSTAIKVHGGYRKGSTDEMYDEGHLLSQSLKVFVKGGVLLIAGKGFGCEPSQLETISNWMNYPADYMSQLFIITSKNRQKALKNQEIEEVNYLTYFFENFGPSLLLNGAGALLVRTGSVHAVSNYLLKRYSVPSKVYALAFQIPNYLFALGLLDHSNAFHNNIQVLENSNVRYAHALLVSLATQFIATYARETVNTYILVPVGQIAVNAPSAIWNYEHPIKDSIRENFEYYKTLVNENIIEPISSFQSTESLSDDNDYAVDL